MTVKEIPEFMEGNKQEGTTNGAQTSEKTSETCYWRGRRLITSAPVYTRVYLCIWAAMMNFLRQFVYVRNHFVETTLEPSEPGTSCPAVTKPVTKTPTYFSQNSSFLLLPGSFPPLSGVGRRSQPAGFLPLLWELCVTTNV